MRCSLADRRLSTSIRPLAAVLRSWKRESAGEDDRNDEVCCVCCSRLCVRGGSVGDGADPSALRTDGNGDGRDRHDPLKRRAGDLLDRAVWPAGTRDRLWKCGWRRADADGKRPTENLRSAVAQTVTSLNALAYARRRPPSSKTPTPMAQHNKMQQGPGR